MGSSGYVIAHEITCAFDNNGATFDAQGNQNDWWIKENYATLYCTAARTWRGTASHEPRAYLEQFSNQQSETSQHNRQAKPV